MLRGKIAAITACLIWISAGASFGKNPKNDSWEGPIDVQPMIDRFASAAGCDRKDFGVLKVILDSTELHGEVHLDYLESKSRPSAKDYDDISWTVTELQATVAEYNALAYAAQKKGCLDMARETYVEVIERFIGEGFTAMRQRAQVGIDDIRELQRKQFDERATDRSPNPDAKDIDQHGLQ